MEKAGSAGLKEKMEDKFCECFFRSDASCQKGGFDEVHCVEDKKGTFVVGTYRNSVTVQTYDGFSD